MNSLGNSQGNISAHYDISNDMFMGQSLSSLYIFHVLTWSPATCIDSANPASLVSGFLSHDMTYSCAIFSALDTDILTSQGDLLANTVAADQHVSGTPSKDFPPPTGVFGSTGISSSQFLFVDLPLHR